MFLVIVEICLFFLFFVCFTFPTFFLDYSHQFQKHISQESHEVSQDPQNCYDLMKSKTEQRCRTLDLFEKRSLLQTPLSPSLLPVLGTLISLNKPREVPPPSDPLISHPGQIKVGEKRIFTHNFMQHPCFAKRTARQHVLSMTSKYYVNQRL